jgi:hypothetical protein
MTKKVFKTEQIDKIFYILSFSRREQGQFPRREQGIFRGPGTAFQNSKNTNIFFI